MLFYHTLFLADGLNAAKKIANVIISFLHDPLITLLKLTSDTPAIPTVIKSIIENWVSFCVVLFFLKLSKLLGYHWS